MSSFQRPKRLACDLETRSPSFGHFFAQPFERGFGSTIGNALRRALLSSIEGAAITAVKIEGVLHEFSSITGVHEDVTDIIMNLKRIPLKLHADHPKTIYLESSGPGPLTSGAIKPDPDLEILDPDIQIANVNETGAGFAAIIAAHLILKQLVEITGIAAARTTFGLIVQGLAGAAGGLIFVRLVPSRD